MNRLFVTGLAMFVAMVGVSLTGADRTAEASDCCASAAPTTCCAPARVSCLDRMRARMAARRCALRERLQSMRCHKSSCCEPVACCEPVQESCDSCGEVVVEESCDSCGDAVMEETIIETDAVPTEAVEEAPPVEEAAPAVEEEA